MANFGNDLPDVLYMTGCGMPDEPDKFMKKFYEMVTNESKSQYPLFMGILFGNYDLLRGWGYSRFEKDENYYLENCVKAYVNYDNFVFLLRNKKWHIVEHPNWFFIPLSGPYSDLSGVML